MRKTFVCLLFAFGVAGCTDTPKPGAAALQPFTPVTMRGYYVSGEGVNMLRSCADNKQYRVYDATGSLDSLYRQACYPAPIPYEAVYAVLTGSLGPKDTADYASETEGALVLNKIDTLQPKTMFNACLPWEFWCHGTEPFWGLQISEAEGGIFLKNMADETGTQYTWAEPRIHDAASWVYETGDDERSLKVIIKKEKCSDGMSDIIYGYSAEVTIGSQTLRGCAVRGGEPIPRPNN